jgi:hypothetical protein
MADHLGGEHVLMGALSAEALDRTVRGATSMRKAA